MPANAVQWAWWLFFAVGALGGIAHLVGLALDVWKHWSR